MSKRSTDKSQAFLQCANCKKILFSIEFEQNLRVCTHCGHHHRIDARTRIAWTFDDGSFEELDSELRSQDPLDFPGTVYGVPRGTSMREIMRRQCAAFGPAAGRN